MRYTAGKSIWANKGHLNKVMKSKTWEKVYSVPIPFTVATPPAPEGDLDCPVCQGKSAFYDEFLGIYLNCRYCKASEYQYFNL